MDESLIELLKYLGSFVVGLGAGFSIKSYNVSQKGIKAGQVAGRDIHTKK